MARYRGNEQVKIGFYWNSSRWEIVTIPKGGGVLPGGDKVRYIRIPLPLVVLLGPLVGAVYVIFLPFIGFAMFFGFAGMRLLSALRKAIGSRLTEAEAVITREE